MSDRINHEVLKDLNVEALDKVIAAIRAAEPYRLLMTEFSTDLTTMQATDENEPPLECNTAYCIMGWINIVYRGTSAYAALGAIDDDGLFHTHVTLFEELRELFHMISLDHPGYHAVKDFDRLPPQLRKDIVLAVLLKFRATGVVDWKTLAMPFMSERARGIENANTKSN